MNSSIRINLLKWLILPLIGINIVGAGLTYWLAWVPAQSAFDQSLADSVWALLPRLQVANEQVSLDLPKPAEQILRVDHVDAIYFTVRGQNGKTIAGDSDFPDLRSPEKFDEPLAYDGAMRDEPIRIISLRTRFANRDILIGAAETLRKRNQTKMEIVVTLIVLETTVTLLVILTVWLAIGRGLSPLRRIQGELNMRQPHDLEPLANSGMPQELTPVVAAINGLLMRVQDGAQAKQKFLTDVAHQLRTPLAGLRAQLEWLQERFRGDGEANQSTALMMFSIEKMSRQTNQLLSLARADPTQYQRKLFESVRLDKLIEQSIEQFIRQADKKSIDLGFELETAIVVGDRFLLSDLIDNLIDNALRYSPPNSKVTVRCFHENGAGSLLVEDEGPGIPEEDREMVFSRFYRLDDKARGSGLGLAIVRDIAMDHDAAIEIGRGSGGVGTVFTVRFPVKKLGV